MNNQETVPELLLSKICWEKTGEPEYPYVNNNFDKVQLKIRVNDFPDEPLYTLLRNGIAVCSFNNWPILWEKS